MGSSEGALAFCFYVRRPRHVIDSSFIDGLPWCRGRVVDLEKIASSVPALPANVLKSLARH